MAQVSSGGHFSLILDTMHSTANSNARLVLEGQPAYVVSGLPAMDYPVMSVFVKNTFLEAANADPSSLMSGFDERKIRSYPTSKISVGCQSGTDYVCSRVDEDSVDNFVFAGLSTGPSTPANSAQDMDGEFVPSMTPAYVSTPTLAVTQTIIADLETLLQDATDENTPPDHLDFSASPQGSFFSGHTDSVDWQNAGICSDLPSVGSRDHGSGTCKPCAHVFTKGCVNGVLCPFCHLCPPGELKRRQKQKRSGHGKSIHGKD